MKLGPGAHFGESLRERSFGGLTVKLLSYQAGQKQPLHVHAHPTLFVLLTGAHRERWRRGEHEQPALAPLYHPTAVHHGSEVGPDGMLAINLEFEPCWLGRHGLEERDLGGYRLLAPSVRARLDGLRLAATAFRAGPEAEAGLETQALEALVPLVREAGREGSGSAPAPRWLRRAEEFLRATFPTPVSLRVVAAEVGVHPVYLARVFRRRHGCSVHEYLLALRLAEAGQSILHRGRPLAEAALAAGFSDQAHLCRCFRREFGVTPKALRAARWEAPPRGSCRGESRSGSP
jgi:AraC family transcriptional regulator